MASNLKSARQAIAAELSHARKGIAYYSARVEALEIALHQLENVEGEEGTAAKKRQAKNRVVEAGNRRRARRSSPAASDSGAASESGAAARRGNAGKRHAGRRAAAHAGKAGGLPTTGSDFWLNLVNAQPRSAVDIANAAIEALGIKPDQTEQIQKMKQRASPALAGLVSAQKIQDSGSGRERRFFRSEGQPA